LINHWEKAQRQKRGSGKVTFSIDAEIEERGEAAFAAELSHSETPEHLFQRTWAEALLTRVFQRLENECEQRGDSRFKTLRPFLTAGGDPPALKAAADELRLSIPAFKSLLHRFRQRYRELLFSEVADTVSDPAEVQEEIRAIVASLRSS
jgi:RNA polymerase sigma-70 factor (ECF subfamily)